MIKTMTHCTCGGLLVEPDEIPRSAAEAGLCSECGTLNILPMSIDTSELPAWLEQQRLTNADKCAYCRAAFGKQDYTTFYRNRMYHMTCYALMQASLDEAAVRYRNALEAIAAGWGCSCYPRPGQCPMCIARDALMPAKPFMTTSEDE